MTGFISEVMHSPEGFSVKHMFLKGWETTKAYWLKALLLLLANIVLGILLVVATSLLAGQSIIAAVLLVIVLIVCMMMFSVAWTRFLLRAVKGEEVSARALFGEMSPKLVFNYFLACVAYLVLITLGFILFVLPGIYFTLVYLFSTLLLVDKNLSVMESFRESKRIIKPHLFEMVSYVATSYALAYLAIVPFYYVAYLLLIFMFAGAASDMGLMSLSTSGSVAGGIIMLAVFAIMIVLLIFMYAVMLFGLGHIYHKLARAA